MTAEERSLEDWQVINGERAKKIAQQLNKMRTPEEKNAYIKKLKDGRIITDEVMKQLIEMKKKGEL